MDDLDPLEDEFLALLEQDATCHKVGRAPSDRENPAYWAFMRAFGWETPLPVARVAKRPWWHRLLRGSR